MVRMSQESSYTLYPMLHAKMLPLPLLRQCLPRGLQKNSDRPYRNILWLTMKFATVIGQQRQRESLGSMIGQAYAKPSGNTSWWADSKRLT